MGDSNAPGARAEDGADEEAAPEIAPRDRCVSSFGIATQIQWLIMIIIFPTKLAILRYDTLYICVYIYINIYTHTHIYICTKVATVIYFD